MKTTSKKQPAKIIVVVHAAPPRGTHNGTSKNKCAWMYRVGAGASPRGPRGGTCGNMVDGWWASNDHYEQGAAERSAKSYAEANGYEYQPR